MGLFITEVKSVALATLVIVASEGVGVSESSTRSFDPMPLAHVEQVAASETSDRSFNPFFLLHEEQVAASEVRSLWLDRLVSKSEAVGITSSLGAGKDPLFIAQTDGLKVWEWRVFPLGEHEVYGVPIRIFMKGRT